MPIVQIKAHGIQDPGVTPFGREARDIQMPGKLICEVKLHAVGLVAQHIRVFAQGIDSRDAQPLIQQRGERDWQTVFGQKVHQKAHLAHLGKLFANVTRFARGDAANLRQLLGIVL